MTLDEIYSKHNRTLIEARQALYNDLVTYRQEHHLDSDVIRTSDNCKGRIIIESVPNSYAFKFYPYNKNGELSKKPSGYIYIDRILDDYKPILRK